MEHMGPLNIIMAAIISGVSAGAAIVSKNAVTDAYQAFKDRLMKKMDESEKAKKTLSLFEEDPQDENAQNMLQKQLESVRADQDTELVHLAQAYLNAVGGKLAGQPNQINIHVEHSPGAITSSTVGTITQTFSNEQKKKSR